MIPEKRTVSNHPRITVDPGNALFGAIHQRINIQHYRLQTAHQLDKRLRDKGFDEILIFMIPVPVIAGPDFKKQILRFT